jgi:hypothetical protein
MSEFNSVSKPLRYNTDGIAYHPVSKPSHYNNTDGGVESDGGPSSYYDFPVDWKTWNDFADYKAMEGTLVPPWECR